MKSINDFNACIWDLLKIKCLYNIKYMYICIILPPTYYLQPFVRPNWVCFGTISTRRIIIKVCGNIVKNIDFGAHITFVSERRHGKIFSNYVKKSFMMDTHVYDMISLFNGRISLQYLVSFNVLCKVRSVLQLFY